MSWPLDRSVQGHVRAADVLVPTDPEMKPKELEGVVRLDEAYSKQEILRRLGISQKFWDKLLDEGLPYSTVGHTRWVTGKNLIEHLSRNAERKACPQKSQEGGSSDAEEARDRKCSTLP